MSSNAEKTVKYIIGRHDKHRCQFYLNLCSYNERIKFFQKNLSIQFKIKAEVNFWRKISDFEKLDLE